MLYLDNLLHLPDLIPLDPPEEKPPIPPRDEDELYEEARDKRAEFIEHFWGKE